MSTVVRRPRVGHIRFLNCLPLYWGLMRSGELLHVDLRPDAPDRLGAALIAGDLDIAPISLVDYLHHVDDLLLLPDLAVGSDGPIRSVNLVSAGPVAGLDGAQIALTPTSRTGALLARLLLTQRYGLRPNFVRRAPPVTLATSGHAPGPAGPTLPESRAGGAVLIGDEALRAHHEGPGHGLTVTDLGKEWRDWTGLPMVFAVWGVRREFAADQPGLVKDVYEAFVRSRELCLAELDEVAAAAARWEPFDASTLAAYFRQLDFSLRPRQLAGLREFASRAAATAAVPPLPAGAPWFAAA